MNRRHEPSRSKGNTSKTTGNDLESRLRSVAFQIADDFASKHVFIDLLKLSCGGIKIAIYIRLIIELVFCVTFRLIVVGFF